MTYNFFEMQDLITVAHRGDEEVDAKPCGVSISIRGEECLLRPRGGCHGPDGEFRVVTAPKCKKDLICTKNPFCLAMNSIFKKMGHSQENGTFSRFIMLIST
ncbi:Uncharacterized protein TCM_003445 [Theobroma cacao]|uniref:Uncharacterized protein n=1 Tax=Theobroma cacao TaxID=3641 RepID=A0A061DVZ3_THECC|nr:Uncharacterized protein TCM_003445 [Theobroma cacao]